MNRRVQVTILNKRSNSSNFNGKVIKEYPKFYLVDTGLFKTCINKADIQCNDIHVKFS